MSLVAVSNIAGHASPFIVILIAFIPFPRGIRSFPALRFKGEADTKAEWGRLKWGLRGWAGPNQRGLVLFLKTATIDSKLPGPLSRGGGEAHMVR